VSDSPSVGQLLRRTEPDRIVEVVEGYVKAYHGGRRVEMLMADYRVAGLWPVLRSDHDLAGSLVDRSVASRVFGAQRASVEPMPGPAGGFRAFAPVTVWGDRLGVLVVDLDTDPGADGLERIGAVADELAIALALADRGTDRFRTTRRRQRLTMAAEMQWDLLPGRALSGPNFLLAGQLEPAYAVCGDHFDWSLDGHRLTVTTLNGDGEGLDATMLTMLAVNAMRNARRSGGNLVEQAELASDTVFGLYGGKNHVATLLLEIDLETGAVIAIDAGSPQAFRMRAGQTSPIILDHQLPLGMFADARYDVQAFTLAAGDRMFIVSDGVHAAVPGGRESFGTRGLQAALRATRLQPATEAVGSVMRGLSDYHGDDDPVDDAVIVCLDWHGPRVEDTEPGRM
jgi:serine phosphatase RsbU (regulator of sigma subunit)